MAITPTTLSRTAGVAAVAAGLIFIGVQVNHPHVDATSISTTEVVVRNSLKVLMRRWRCRALADAGRLLSVARLPERHRLDRPRFLAVEHGPEGPDAATTETVVNCSLVVGIIAVTPWRYVWRNYVRASGDRWR